MMNIVEEAIIYATIMHQGKVRKFTNNPFILHPLEVAQILSTMTSDIEVITAGILHDIVEDTDGTLSEIEKRFGKRVADMVSSESEPKYPDEDRSISWKRRKQEALRSLQNSDDIGVKMLWLGDKLANLRSLAAIYSEKGDELWQDLNQSDPDMQFWYYKTVAEILEYSLNRTGAFKEYIKHINFIWPGTFDSEKSRYRKYREVSVEGCQIVGQGAKGDVYRYDDELVIKVFNERNTYGDVEQEIAMSRKTFVLGIPTAISFGIVSVGDRYGAMYELLDSETISRHIARSPGRVDYYAMLMAELAHTIHSVEVTEDDGFPTASRRVMSYIDGGVGEENDSLAERIRLLYRELPPSATLIHGDFHTGNVFLVKEEPLLIDLDRIAMGNPIVEISDLYYFYVVLGEDDPAEVEKFMGFSLKTAKQFYYSFIKHYLGTDDEDRIGEVTAKASILGYSRLIRKIRKKKALSHSDRKRIEICLEKIEELLSKVDTLIWC